MPAKLEEETITNFVDKINNQAISAAGGMMLDQVNSPVNLPTSVNISQIQDNQSQQVPKREQTEVVSPAEPTEYELDAKLIE